MVTQDHRQEMGNTNKKAAHKDDQMKGKEQDLPVRQSLPRTSKDNYKILLEPAIKE